MFDIALAKAGWTRDDVQECKEVRPNVWHVLYRTHRIVWYILTANGQVSPL